MYICGMVTYKEQLKRRKYYLINKDNITVGLFSTLKKLCEHMNEVDTGFPSYWTIVRMDRTQPIKIGHYIIQEIQLN